MASLRAKDVVKQLLTFSRKMDIEREPVDIRVIVRETLKLLRAAIPSTIQIREILPADIDPVVANPTQIHQLLINLCNNAAQAMSDEGGSLSIELSNVVLDFEAASKHPDLQPGAYVRFSVSDTGCGIPADLLDRVFDPYFTTKDIGKGTGMGLAVVHGIVKAHNGAIDIQSHVGKGTTVHVYFPSSKSKALQKKTESETLPIGNEKILFVDDEISIVKLFEKILSGLGYSVSSSTDPIQIQKLFNSDPDKYDLVISDMTMPNMTGDKLARELLNTRPDVPILICTGHSEKMSLEKANEIGIKGLLMKPVMKTDLAKTVRRVLDEATLKTEI
jgi:CheY-like chemotaxis protein